MRSIARMNPKLGQRGVEVEAEMPPVEVVDDARGEREHFKAKVLLILESLASDGIGREAL